MPNIIVLIAMLLGIQGDKQTELKEFNVSGIQCQQISRGVTVQKVYFHPDRYIDSCIQWEGRVESIVDADVDETKAWVIPIEGRFAFCGSTLMTISFLGTGVESFSSDWAFPEFDFLAAHPEYGIKKGDNVSFTGKVLGISRRPDQEIQGRKFAKPLFNTTKRPLIAITEMHTIPIHWESAVDRSRGLH